MHPYQKCQRSVYCQENCIVHPKTKKIMTTCQKHWDFDKKSRQKRKHEIDDDEDVGVSIKRPKVRHVMDNNNRSSSSSSSSSSSNSGGMHMNQLSESRSQTETSRHINVAQIENTQYKEHRKTEKISENEEIIFINTQRINCSEKYIQESEVQARSVMLSVKEKLLKRSLEEFKTNSFFVYYTCQTTHASQVQNILKDIQGTAIAFSDIVLKEVLAEISDDAEGWNITAFQKLEKMKERCGFNISLLIAHGYFPYDRFMCIPESAYVRKLTEMEIYNRDNNISMSDYQRDLTQESIEGQVDLNFETFVKCTLISKSDRFDRTIIYVPACIFSAYNNRWKGYKVEEVTNESKELSVYQPDGKEMENFKSVLSDGLKTFEMDFIRDFYPENYWENKKTLETLGEVYNECTQNNWDVKNRHLYNQAQIFLNLYPTVDDEIKKKFDVMWFNKMEHYYNDCLEDIDRHPKRKVEDEYDPYDSDEDDDDDEGTGGKKKKKKQTKEQFKQKIMERIMRAPQIAEEKRKIYNYGNTSMNHSRAFADEWDFAKRKCDENKKFEV